MATKLVAELEKDSRFDRPRLTNEPTQPQLAVSIDRERASDLGIDITGLAQALQSVLDGYKIGSVYIEDRSFDVKLVSTDLLRSVQRSDRSGKRFLAYRRRALCSDVDDCQID